MTGLYEIQSALADQIRGQLAGTADVIAELQVEPLLNPGGTPPCIDIYPAEEFQTSIAYGRGNKQMRFVVRAKTGAVDQQAVQILLLSMMDPQSETSVEQAILEDRSLGGKVEHVHVEGPSNFGLHDDYLGCTWTAVVTP